MPPPTFYHYPLFRIAKFEGGVNYILAARHCAHRLRCKDSYTTSGIDRYGKGEKEREKEKQVELRSAKLSSLC